MTSSPTSMSDNHLLVDLASIYSAYCVQDERGEVLEEGDSGGLSAFQFAALLARVAIRHDVSLVLVEDVPYGISNQGQVKAPLRFQGVVMLACHKHVDRMAFVNPATWQNAYEGVARAPKGMKGKQAERYRIEAAARHAKNFGYEPPNLVQQYLDTLPEGTRILKKNTDPLEKQMTDYVDAFLMGRWVRRFETYDELLAASGVQPPMI